VARKIDGPDNRLDFEGNKNAGMGPLGSRDPRAASLSPHRAPLCFPPTNTIIHGNDNQVDTEELCLLQCPIDPIGQANEKSYTSLETNCLFVVSASISKLRVRRLETNISLGHG